MNKTSIEWADMTWNPVTGCKHGCEYCYARRIANRFGGHDGYGCEKDHDRVEIRHEYFLTEPAYIKRGKGKKITAAPFPFVFEPTFHHYRLDEPQHIKAPQTIFVCSMADLFGAWVPVKWIVDVLDACRKAPQHRYLFLTKNPARYIELDEMALLPRDKNFWYGTTATTEDAPIFFSDMHNTFASIEPILGPFHNHQPGSLSHIDWFIVGAETGNRKGKVVPEREWVQEIMDYCKDTGKPLLMKDSLIPIVGEENMRREFPWLRQEAQHG